MQFLVSTCEFRSYGDPEDFPGYLHDQNAVVLLLYPMYDEWVALVPQFGLRFITHFATEHFFIEI